MYGGEEIISNVIYLLNMNYLLVVCGNYDLRWVGVCY